MLNRKEPPRLPREAVIEILSYCDDPDVLRKLSRVEELKALLVKAVGELAPHPDAVLRA